MEIIKGLVEFLQNNPVVFVIIFFLSLIANIIQIYQFSESRRQLRKEISERAKLARLVETYEYILNLAEKNIKTESELTSIEQEIMKKGNLVQELDVRIKALQLTGQKTLVSQLLERNISELLQTYNDIVKLRTEYANLGELPDIPENSRLQIEEQINIAIRRPYEFPKSFAFKSILLVLFIFLLPWPVDTFLVVIFLGIFLGTFFEAVALYNDPNVSGFIKKHANLIGLVATFGAWLSLLQALRQFYFEPLDIFLVSLQTSYYNSMSSLPRNNLFETIMSARWSLVDVLSIVLSLIIAIMQWRAMKERVTRPLFTESAEKSLNPTTLNPS